MAMRGRASVMHLSGVGKATYDDQSSPTRAKSHEAKYPSHWLDMARDLILTFGDFRKAAQRQNTATTGSTSSSRCLRTAFSSRRLTAISAMFEGLPSRAGRFAFSALGTDCSLVLISSARYLYVRIPRTPPSCIMKELELLSAVWGAAHKGASLVRGPVRGHHGVSLGGGLSR